MADLTIIPDDGTYIIHRAGCADLRRVERRTPGWTKTYRTPEDLAEDLWGDIAADRFPRYSQEWEFLIMEYLDIDTVVKPCVKFGGKQ